MKLLILYFLFIGTLMGLATKTRADTVDNFQVYLKDEIVLRESDNRPEVFTIKMLVLAPDNLSDTVFVNYSHGTAQATGRKIVIWHGEEILFSHSFGDKGAERLMALPVEDLAALYKIADSKAPVLMYYYDDQLPPDGVMLANIRIDQPVLPKETNVPVNRKSVDQSVLERSVAGSMIIVLLFMAYRKFTKKPQTDRWEQRKSK